LAYDDTNYQTPEESTMRQYVFYGP